MQQILESGSHCNVITRPSKDTYAINYVGSVPDDRIFECQSCCSYAFNNGCVQWQPSTFPPDVSHIDDNMPAIYQFVAYHAEYLRHGLSIFSRVENTQIPLILAVLFH